MDDADEAAGGKLRVALFAGMADVAGTRLVSLPWHGGTVADARRLLRTMHPALGPLLDRSAVAIGDRYAADDEAVPEGADLAVIPPVSGG